jgi:hypothetical protein
MFDQHPVDLPPEEDHLKEIGTKDRFWPLSEIIFFYLN